MVAMVTEDVYKNRDNVIEWFFKERKFDHESETWKEEPIDFISKAKVTKMVLHIDGHSIESGSGEVEFFDGGKVILTLGHVPELNVNIDVPVTIDVFSGRMPKGKTMVHPGKAKSSANIRVLNSPL